MNDYKLYTLVGAITLRKKIASIKTLRELVPGMSLIDAKHWVERHWDYQAYSIVDAVNNERRDGIVANIAKLEAERANIVSELQNAKNLLSDIDSNAQINQGWNAQYNR